MQPRQIFSELQLDQRNYSNSNHLQLSSISNSESISQSYNPINIQSPINQSDQRSIFSLSSNASITSSQSNSNANKIREQGAELQNILNQTQVLKQSIEANIKQTKNQVLRFLETIIKSTQENFFEEIKKLENDIKAQIVKAQEMNRLMQEQQNSNQLKEQLMIGILNLENKIKDLADITKSKMKKSQKVKQQIFNGLIYFLKSNISQRNPLPEVAQLQNLQSQSSYQNLALESQVYLELKQVKNIYQQQVENLTFKITQQGIQGKPNFLQGVTIGGRKQNQDDPIDIEFRERNVELQQFKIIFLNGFWLQNLGTTTPTCLKVSQDKPLELEEYMTIVLGDSFNIIDIQQINHGNKSSRCSERIINNICGNQ